MTITDERLAEISDALKAYNSDPRIFSDAVAIFFVRTAVPELIAEIKTLRNEIRALETANKILTLNLDTMP